MRTKYETEYQGNTEIVILIIENNKNNLKRDSKISERLKHYTIIFKNISGRYQNKK